MHRIERIELDLPDGNLPSLSQRFSAKTGLNSVAVLEFPGADGNSGIEGKNDRSGGDYQHSAVDESEDGA